MVGEGGEALHQQPGAARPTVLLKTGQGQRRTGAGRGRRGEEEKGRPGDNGVVAGGEVTSCMVDGGEGHWRWWCRQKGRGFVVGLQGERGRRPL